MESNAPPLLDDARPAAKDRAQDGAATRSPHEARQPASMQPAPQPPTPPATPSPAPVAAPSHEMAHTSEAKHVEGPDPASLPKIRWWIVLPALALAAFAFYRLYLLGMGPRHERDAALDAATVAYDPRPTVEVVRPRKGKSTLDLRLPADLDAMQQTAIFARTTGYVKSVLVDIGDPVTATQLIAEIDTPEVDAQIVTAQASVTVAEANVAKIEADAALARSTLKRFTEASLAGGVAAQDLDEKKSAVTQAETSLRSAHASVELAKAEMSRLVTLQQFEKVRAPFDGVVTARGYDVGALVGPSASSASTPLFRIERSDVLRIWVNVPQTYVESAKKDAKGYLTLRNWPGREFEARLARTAGVLDPASRTLRSQFEVANPDRTLFPGMFGELRFPVTTANPTLTVPTSAPTFGSAGPTLWVVEGKQVKARKATLGRDFGSEIEVLDGIRPEDDVVRNPGERLLDGLEVNVVAAPPADAKPGAPTQPALQKAPSPGDAAAKPPPPQK